MTSDTKRPLFKSVDFEEAVFKCPLCGKDVLATVPNDVAVEVTCKSCGSGIRIDPDACDEVPEPN